MSDLQYMVFMGIFVMLLFVYEIYVFLRTEKRGYNEILKRIFYKYALFGFVSFIGIIPLTLENILTATSSDNFLKLSPSETVMYSADLLSFFLPSVLHPVFGNIMTDIYSNFSGNTSENTMFIGYTVILLSLFAVHRLKGNKYVKFWLIAALSFSIISLGPLLHDPYVDHWYEMENQDTYPASGHSWKRFFRNQEGLTKLKIESDFSTAIKDIEALILAVPHNEYLNFEPETIVKMAGGPIAVIDCFGILSDKDIKKYFELGCEVKALGRGHENAVIGTNPVVLADYLKTQSQ